MQYTTIEFVTRKLLEGAVIITPDKKHRASMRLNRCILINSENHDSVFAKVFSDVNELVAAMTKIKPLADWKIL